MDHDHEAVIARERRLLDPDVRDDDAAVRSLLHKDFREFDSTGTVWDYRSIVRATGGGSVKPIAAEDFRPVRIAPDAILMTYTARLGTQTSLRTSVWVRVEGTWLLLHHQGTTVRTHA